MIFSTKNYDAPIEHNALLDKEQLYPENHVMYKYQTCTIFVCSIEESQKETLGGFAWCHHGVVSDGKLIMPQVIASTSWGTRLR